MLYFDHCFTEDPKHRFYKSLEDRGFILDPMTVEHPGKVFSRFIMLKGRKPRGVQYLEFIYIKPGGKKYPGPGLSFGYSKNLEAFAKKLKARFEHKNYDWKADTKSRLPGWNFVTFKKIGLTKFYPFITEYEPNPNKPKKLVQPKHPNGAQTLIALEFDVHKPAREFFARLAGPKLTMMCGTKLIVHDAKKFAFRRVIIKSASLQRFKSKNKDLETGTWNGKPSVTIPNPAEGWDIVVI